jgi:hypothetical protein
MKSSRFSKFTRVIYVLMILAVFGLTIPGYGQAASPTITIVSIKDGESVTVHASGLPAGMSFAARMDKATTTASNGVFVGTGISASDGTFDATYAIPASLITQRQIAIRIESATGGWYAYNWFTNQAKTPVPGTTTTPTATASNIHIEVIAVEENTRIRVRATNFPANIDFKVRIGPYYTFGQNQQFMATINSGTGGSFLFNVNLPAIVRDVSLVTIRMDAVTGSLLYTYNAFTNVNKGTFIPNPTVPTPIYIEIVAVEKNNRVTISTANFPANTDFKVRVGPYYTFGRDQQIVATINSGTGGSFLFNITLPAIVKNISLVTILIDSVTDSELYTAYNAFTNENKGSVVPNPTVPTETPEPSNQGRCQILSITPTQSMVVNKDFDAAWEVKNTSTKNWNNLEIKFRYQSGDKFYKNAGMYDLPKYVKPGETVILVADMLAPGKTGIYSTVFVLVIGDDEVICTLPLTITVK